MDAADRLEQDGFSVTRAPVVGPDGAWDIRFIEPPLPERSVGCEACGGVMQRRTPTGSQWLCSCGATLIVPWAAG